MNELITVNREEIAKQINTFHVQNVLDEIKEFTESFVPDMETKQGRTDIASLAMKIAKSKTYIDGIGKEIVTELKAKPKLIDAERKKARDFLDNLKNEIRKPLTDWENAEKERVEKHDFNLKLIKDQLTQINTTLPIEDIERSFKFLNDLDLSTYEEFQNRATMYLKESISYVESMLIDKRSMVKAKEDHDRLLKENEELERKNREAKIKADAKEKAEKDAEVKAQLEKEKLILDKKKAEQELRDIKEKAENDKLKAIENEKRIIQEQKEIAERAKKKEEHDRLLIEQQKINEEKRLKEAEEKRVLDFNHRRKINLDASLSLLNTALFLNKEQAETIVRSIIQGKIENISIKY